MLKASSRLLAQLSLASDLMLIGACWVEAYFLRFYVVGPFPLQLGLPDFEGYALQLMPILAVWTVAFRTFGLYRPRRLGSYLSEWIDVAKASTVGVLVLIAIMTFFFRGYEYSRLVILYFWVLSIVLGAIGDDPVTIHFVPDVFGLVSLRGGIEEFEGVPLLHLRESPLHGWSKVLKRAFDVVFSVLAVALAAPVMLGIAIAIRLTSPGPILIRQERMGLDGPPFPMLKFRTMRPDAEAATGPVWAQPADDRRTPAGAFLRRWSLDELPQLFNVLRGEMSLVGPRPERPFFVDEFRRKIPGYMLRPKVQAGMTGWAQINGWRGNTSLEKRIEYDLYYIERWSLGFDLKILVRTIWRGFFSKHAY